MGQQSGNSELVSYSKPMFYFGELFPKNQKPRASIIGERGGEGGKKKNRYGVEQIENF